MFCDITKIKVQAWEWGNWCVSARREKYIEFWWPNWGNRWKWWDMIIRVNPHINSLIKLHTRKNFKAQAWEHWKWRNKNWLIWENTILEVPQWTQVKNLSDWEVYDLKEANAEVIIAHGGRWGYWNAHYTTSTRQFPDFAELWEPTKEIELELELKLIADVWIIWVPSSWKSTFISRITNIKAKIWNYDFTTLIPNIWVASVLDSSLVVTDIPWLIEWASEWKWLWTEFLRHISRNSILIHLLDANSMDIFKDYTVIQNELIKYWTSSWVDLFSKPQIVVINKSDLLDSESKDLLKNDFLEKCKNKWIVLDCTYFISAITWEWVDDLMKEVFNIVQKTKNLPDLSKQEEDGGSVERVLYTPHLEEDPRHFELTKSDEITKDWKSIFCVEWKRIVQIGKMTNFEQRGWLDRLHDVLKKLWIQSALTNLWAVEGDKVRFWDWGMMLDFRESL